MDAFYVMAIVVILLFLGAWYVWEKGLLGTATEARLKEIRAAMAAKLKHDLEVLDQKIEAKVAARMAKVQPAAEVTLVGPTADPRDKATRIAENMALLAKGTITQAQFDAAQTEILKS